MPIYPKNHYYNDYNYYNYYNNRYHCNCYHCYYKHFYYNHQIQAPYHYRSNTNTVPQSTALATSHARPHEQTRQEFSYATREMMETNLTPTESEPPKMNYHLEVVQQPICARMFGFGTKDRRQISPLPFVRLRFSDENGPINSSTIDPEFFTLQVMIYNYKTDKEVPLVIHPSSRPGHQIRYENLVGEKIVNGIRLLDTDGEKDIWFIFKDLSVRADGIFYLKFTLIDVGWQGVVNTNPNPIKVLGSVNSQPFTVYTAYKFPGMTEATPLTRCFAKQKVKIQSHYNKNKR